MATAEQLFAQSVVVTDTHYSTTTLMGAILGCSSHFHVVQEPLNAEPTLGFHSLAPVQWYHYDYDEGYPALRAGLIGAMRGAPPLWRNVVERAAKIRSRHDVLRVAKYTATNLRLRIQPRPAVFKDPFLAFSAASLQGEDGLKVVLCLRHPCAFAESLRRRDAGFDFANQLQPALLETLPDLADDIRLFAQKPQSLLEQAALLWRVVYQFAAETYLDDPRSVTMRQDDLVAAPQSEVARLFDGLGLAQEPAVEQFVQEALNAGASADFAGVGGSYVHRDGQQTLNKWHERVTPEEMVLVRRRVGPVAERYGY